ncbi:hypothetical protein ACFLV7_10990 [Chloroflexota bacterium]
MNLLQVGPADTTSYMIAGFAVIFGVMFLYVLSLVVRKRNLEKDLEVLAELDQE